LHGTGAHAQPGGRRMAAVDRRYGTRTPAKRRIARSWGT
jgi:hypothetical protein